MRKIIWLVFFILPASFYGQEVTIINNFPHSGAADQPQEYVLKRVTQHTYVVNEYEPSQSSPRAQVAQLISYSLRSFADNQYRTQANRAIGAERGKSFAGAAAGIVRNALWIHDQPFHDAFESFSPEVEAMADRLYELDGYRIELDQGAEVSAGKRSVGLYFFQRLVYQLKVRMEEEVSRFLDQHMGGTGSSPTTHETSEEETPYLVPLDLSLDPMKNNAADLAAIMPEMPSDFGKPQKMSRRQRRRADQNLFSEKMVSLLEENNRILANYGYRFESMQSQIDSERETRADGIESIREEVRALREIVKTGFTSGAATGPVASTDAAAPPMVEVIFERNGHELSAAHRASLNRIDIAMRRNTSLHAMIIGYADRTGDPDYNAWLSRQRANAVRAYLLEKGLPPDRLEMNYVGDAASDAPNPADRKVEVLLQ